MEVSRMSRPPTIRQQRRMLDAIVDSPTYRKAYQDDEFLNREELRPIRLQLELLKPELALTELDIRSTIVVFGSARIPSPEAARAKVAELTRALRARPRDRRLVAGLRAAERLLEHSRYYDEARKFGKIVTRASQDDRRHKKREFVIVTGGGPGIMEAANRGAWEAKGKSIGLNITLPHEQEPNPYLTPELSFRFHYFALRKMHFLMRAKAMVAFPGGFGTFDELFETLTLVQTSKKHGLPIILFGSEFWKKVINFEYLSYVGVISPQDMKLFKYVDTAEQAWKAIRDYWGTHGGMSARKRVSFRPAALDEEEDS
ncbi:MAG: TIGR00730 family Rossman fold protein [Elusimicrobia bacterium]|nr:TIGR00730 family Rossman fold protein [Elusimicrobiota bacterium]